jgi:hypothetical protein
MLLAAIRSGVSGLMAEILADHIRLPMMNPDQEMESPEEFGEDLIGAGAGLSKLTKHGTLPTLGWFCKCFCPFDLDQSTAIIASGKKKDGPEPPKPSLENPPG